MTTCCFQCLPAPTFPLRLCPYFVRWASPVTSMICEQVAVLAACQPLSRPLHSRGNGSCRSSPAGRISVDSGGVFCATIYLRKIFAGNRSVRFPNSSRG